MSQTVAQYYISIGPMYHVIWVVAFLATGAVERHSHNSIPSAEVVLSQRRRQFVGIEPAMGCDAGPTLNRNRVGRPTSCVP